MKFKWMTSVALLSVCMACSRGVAQTAAGDGATAATPADLVKLVLQQFATGSEEEFDTIVPDPEAQGVVGAAIKRKATREPNLGEVIWKDSNRAVLLLTGTVVDKSSASETIRSRHFSGLYEAVHSGGRWKISRQLPFDADNHILSHSIDADVVPTQSISIKDTLEIVAGSKYGFAVRLNDRAQISDVRMNGKPVKHEFGGGVLWVAAPKVPKAKLFVAYTLAEDRDSDGPPKDEAGKLAEREYGAFENADVWHPLFDFDSANDTGTFAITLRIPAAYYATMSIPQTETVEKGVRTIRGRSDGKFFALTLIYDSGWRPTTAKIGRLQFATFLTPEFKWSPEVLGAQVRETYDLLTPRFGDPQGTYFAVGEQRTIGKSGFRYRTNDLVVSGQGGGKQLLAPADDAASEPSAPFAHEVSHGWTMQATGPAANFLREGWATFCEWTFLGSKYGPAVEPEIWESAYNFYILGGHNGVRSILGNPDNGSVHYTKGAWIFHMLESAMGQAAFDSGMRTYIQIPLDQPAGYQEFIAAMSHAAGHDMTAFVMPWITSKYIPDLDVQVEGLRIVVTQRQADIFSDLTLPLTYETMSGEVVKSSVHITGKMTTVETGSPGSIRQVRLDPEHEYLLLRHLGENVRFELHAPAAKEVALSGGFAVKPVPAVRHGDIWAVEMPMVNGRYNWAWQIDGKAAEPNSNLEGQPLTGVRYVKPVSEMESAYPR